MATKKPYQSFLRHYYLSASLYDFIFAYAIYTVLFSMKGLSPFQISLLLAWWAFTSFALEIPSGALADYWSRKKLLVIAPLIKSLCFLIWFFAGGNVYLYGLGFLFWSIGETFVSGTTEALLYDHMAYYKKEDDYEKVVGRKKFYFYLAQAVAIALGGVMAHYGIEWALVFSIIPLLFSSFFAFLIKETPKVESTQEINYLNHISEAVKEVRGNKKLLYLFAFSLGISIAGFIEEFDQLYYELVNLPLLYFGILEAVFLILYALLSDHAHRLKGHGYIFYLFPLLSGLLFVLSGLYTSIPSIAMLMVAYLLIAPLLTLNDAKIQHSIRSESRATVTSVDSFLLNLFGILLTIGAGIISKIWNLEAVYIGTGVCLLIFAFFGFFKRKTLL